MSSQLIPQETPLVILAEGCFGEHASKTATGVIRYGQWPIAAVIDSTQLGQSVRSITDIPCDAPIVQNLQEALAYNPKALLLGTAPQGGGLPSSWKTILYEAVDQGLHIISGLHDFLRDDLQLVQRAQKKNVLLWDVRDPLCCTEGPQNIVAKRQSRPPHTKVVTLVGTDCCVGKMFSALELWKGFQKKGYRSDFIATGQTGILISGKGVPLDRMVGDFMAGHVERVIQESIFPANNTPESHWIFVEGQGSLAHPGYSGVTMSLLHGSNPDAMILCHNPKLSTIWGYDLPLPSLSEFVSMYETAAGWIRFKKQEPSPKVLGIALNTSDYPETSAREIITQIQDETDLPVTDPVRFGVTPLVSALEELLCHSKPS